MDSEMNEQENKRPDGPPEDDAPRWGVLLYGGGLPKRMRAVDGAFGTREEAEEHAARKSEAAERYGAKKKVARLPRRFSVIALSVDGGVAGDPVVLGETLSFEEATDLCAERTAGSQNAAAEDYLVAVKHGTAQVAGVSAVAAVVLAAAVAGCIWATRPAVESPLHQPREAGEAPERLESTVSVTVESADPEASGSVGIELTDASGDKVHGIAGEAPLNEETEIGTLPAGEYEIDLTDVPEGYAAPEGPIAFTVDGQGDPVELVIRLEDESGEDTEEEAGPGAGGAEAADSEGAQPQASGSGSGPVGGGPDGGAAASEPSPAPEPAPDPAPACQHNWLPATETIWVYHDVCTVCGAWVDEAPEGAGEHMKNHALNGERGSVLGTTVPVEAETGGYYCSLCGATK